MAKPCIFCLEEKPLTREHVLAQWVDDLFPADAKSPGTIVSTKSDGSSRVYTMLPFEQTVKDFCGDCNGGWMRDLEHRVAPILGPMVLHGRPTRLAPTHQEAIAAWAIKTACVLQCIYPTDRVIPKSEYHRFYNEKRPLPKQIVWIGNRFNLTDSTGLPNLFASKWRQLNKVAYDNTVSHDDIKRQIFEEKRTTYRVVFALGHVVFVAYGYTLKGGMRFEIPRPLAIETIWPVQPRVKWPPPKSIDAIGGINALHDAFDVP